MTLIYAGKLTSADGSTKALTAANFPGMPTEAKPIVFSTDMAATNSVYVGTHALVKGTGAGVFLVLKNAVADHLGIDGSNSGWVHPGDYGIAPTTNGEGCYVGIWG